MAHTADMHGAHATRSRRWSPLETLSFVTACSALLWLAIIQLAQAA